MPLGCSYLENVKIGVVEPNDFMRNVLMNVLRAFGARDFKCAKNGHDGLQLVRETSPDMVLTEARLPGVSGFDLVRVVRCGDGVPDPYVPIIMVSAHTDANSVLMARDVGVNEYVAKPVSPKALIRRIVEVVERPRPFVRSGEFFGPDRRRREDDAPGADRRVSEPELVGDSGRGLSQYEINRLIAGQEVVSPEGLGSSLRAA